MQPKRILIVEDDAPIRQGIADALRYHGYQALEADGGPDSLERAVRGDYDLLLLDLVLPARDGLEILGEVQQALPTLPVIILTARGEESDRVRGLRLGADDYVVKPFSVRELLARVEAVLRRSPERPRPVGEIRFPGGTVDTAGGRIRFDDGREGQLTVLEADLLRYLGLHPGRIVSRDEILARVWHLPGKGLETRTVDMHVARLRDKLGDPVDGSGLIRTVRGQGYQLVPVEAP
jgi:DNA-binding response OmpR family regulator